MKKIEILFGPNGEIEIEAFGYNGKGCKDATEFLEQALGNERDTKLKAQWFIENAEDIQRTKKFGINSARLCG